MLSFEHSGSHQRIQYDKPADRRQQLPRNCDRGGHHLGILVDDVDVAAAYLRSKGCTVLETIAMSEGPLAGKRNMYVQDPWGHQLELVD